jgi:hypothetical protein
MARRPHYPCTFIKACHVKHIVLILRQSMTHAAIVVGLNVGTVSHVIPGRRFPESFPIPID